MGLGLEDIGLYTNEGVGDSESSGEGDTTVVPGTGSGGAKGPERISLSYKTVN